MIGKEIQKIIAEHFPGIESLETRGLDSLDFHDVHVESIVKAVTEAYRAGGLAYTPYKSYLSEEEEESLRRQYADYEE
jgi:hypothetical protein